HVSRRALDLRPRTVAAGPSGVDRCPGGDRCGGGGGVGVGLMAYGIWLMACGLWLWRLIKAGLRVASLKQGVGPATDLAAGRSGAAASRRTPGLPFACIAD